MRAAGAGQAGGISSQFAARTLCIRSLFRSFPRLPAVFPHLESVPQLYRVREIRLRGLYSVLVNFRCPIRRHPQYPIKLADGFYIIRKLTVLECKRLQTVPDSYIFPVSDTQAYRQLGNGWTVDVIAPAFYVFVWNYKAVFPARNACDRVLAHMKNGARSCWLELQQTKRTEGKRSSNHTNASR